MVTVKQGSSSTVRFPRFSTVYLPDESEDDLELPILLNGFFPKSLPTSVCVRSTSEKVWNMALRRCFNNGVKYALVDGWKKIVMGEGLRSGDFLRFEFDGSHRFNFCIYDGLSMCKRLKVRPIQIDDDETDDDEAEVDDETEGDDENENDVEADGEDIEADEEEEDVTPYLDDPENPFFTAALNPKKRSELRIPAQVLKDYNLNFPEMITLVDPLAERYGKFEKRIKIETNGSVFIKGFSNVISRNKVKLSDKMVIEIKKIGSNPVHEIKVYIIRG